MDLEQFVAKEHSERKLKADILHLVSNFVVNTGQCEDKLKKRLLVGYIYQMNPGFSLMKISMEIARTINSLYRTHIYLDGKAIQPRSWNDSFYGVRLKEMELLQQKRKKAASNGGGVKYEAFGEMEREQGCVSDKKDEEVTDSSNLVELKRELLSFDDHFDDNSQREVDEQQSGDDKLLHKVDELKRENIELKLRLAVQEKKHFQEMQVYKQIIRKMKSEKTGLREQLANLQESINVQAREMKKGRVLMSTLRISLQDDGEGSGGVPQVKPNDC